MKNRTKKVEEKENVLVAMEEEFYEEKVDNNNNNNNVDIQDKGDQNDKDTINVATNLPTLMKETIMVGENETLKTMEDIQMDDVEEVKNNIFKNACDVNKWITIHQVVS